MASLVLREEACRGRWAGRRNGLIARSAPHSDSTNKRRYERARNGRTVHPKLKITTHRASRPIRGFPPTDEGSRSFAFPGDHTDTVPSLHLLALADTPRLLMQDDPPPAARHRHAGLLADGRERCAVGMNEKAFPLDLEVSAGHCGTSLVSDTAVRWGELEDLDEVPEVDKAGNACDVASKATISLSSTTSCPPTARRRASAAPGRRL
ncbi:hypothetical protein GCM10020219_104790 [Nonomuraea dietziae]